MALLATAQKARVKQKFEYLEVISGCEMQNEYYVIVARTQKEIDSIYLKRKKYQHGPVEPSV